jgi:hypothetical protein
MLNFKLSVDIIGSREAGLSPSSGEKEGMRPAKMQTGNACEREREKKGYSARSKSKNSIPIVASSVLITSAPACLLSMRRIVKR